MEEPEGLSGAALQGPSQRRWRNYSHPKYRRIVSDWTARDLNGMTTDQLLGGVKELVDAAAEYYTSVQAIIPIAATSEILLTWFYDAVVRQKDEPPAQVFVLGSDSEPIRAEKSLYDLATWTRGHQELAESLAHPAAAEVPRGSSHLGGSGVA